MNRVRGAARVGAIRELVDHIDEYYPGLIPHPEDDLRTALIQSVPSELRTGRASADDVWLLLTLTAQQRETMIHVQRRMARESNQT